MQNKLIKHKDKILIGILFGAILWSIVYLFSITLFQTNNKEDVNLNSEIEIINKSFK